jgi:hypothetical protein
MVTCDMSVAISSTICQFDKIAFYNRVVRWFVFKPKIHIWVNFGGSCNGRCWYILWIRGPFYVLCYIWCSSWTFGIFFPFCTKKNPATLFYNLKFDMMSFGNFPFGNPGFDIPTLYQEPILGTTLSCNASVVKIYSATNSMARSIIKTIFPFYKKFPSLPRRWPCSCKFKSRRIGSCHTYTYMQYIHRK